MAFRENHPKFARKFFNVGILNFRNAPSGPVFVAANLLPSVEEIRQLGIMNVVEKRRISKPLSQCSVPAVRLLAEFHAAKETPAESLIPSVARK